MGENGKVEEVRTCKVCGETKPITSFRLEKGRWRKHTCQKCVKHRYFVSHKEQIRQYTRDREKLVKQEVINHYGGRCACCGESDPRFLTMDHKNGGGRKHQKEIKKTRFFMWVKRNNFPDYLQVLCFNCNCGRSVNGGICPHKDNYKNNKTKVVKGGCANGKKETEG